MRKTIAIAVFMMMVVGIMSVSADESLMYGIKGRSWVNEEVGHIYTFFPSGHFNISNGEGRVLLGPYTLSSEGILTLKAEQKIDLNTGQHQGMNLIIRYELRIEEELILSDCSIFLNETEYVYHSDEN